MAQMFLASCGLRIVSIWVGKGAIHEYGWLRHCCVLCVSDTNEILVEIALIVALEGGDVTKSGAADMSVFFAVFYSWAAGGKT